MAKEQFIAMHCGVRKIDIKCYNPPIRHFLETVIGSAVHWLIEVNILPLVLVLVGFNWFAIVGERKVRFSTSC